MSRARESGITQHPLFVGATRPAMTFGVTWAGLVINLCLTMEVFLFTRNLAWLLVAIPIHVMMWIACLHDPNYFDLVVHWVRTRLLGWFHNLRFWRANSYSPLSLPQSYRRGWRRGP